MASKVPPFLSKLTEIVNEAKTNHLISWSEQGDSFLVRDPERFSRDVLPHWFKHSNWNAFVRQLHAYGFRKVSDLQQGALRPRAETSVCSYAHPNFHKAQKHLLGLVQRNQSGKQPDKEKANSSNAGLVGSINVSSASMHAIAKDIAAIQLLQANLAAELNEIKREQQTLSQDCMTIRASHQKQQDTVNRIVHFLAGIFGQGASQNEPPSSHSLAIAPSSSRPSQLMIEGGGSSHSDNGAMASASAEASEGVQLGVAANQTSMAELPSTIFKPTSPVVHDEAMSSVLGPTELEPVWNFTGQLSMEDIQHIMSSDAMLLPAPFSKSVDSQQGLLSTLHEQPLTVPPPLLSLPPPSGEPASFGSVSTSLDRVSHTMSDINQDMEAVASDFHDMVSTSTPETNALWDSNLYGDLDSIFASEHFSFDGDDALVDTLSLDGLANNASNTLQTRELKRKSDVGLSLHDISSKRSRISWDDT